MGSATVVVGRISLSPTVLFHWFAGITFMMMVLCGTVLRIRNSASLVIFAAMSQEPGNSDARA